MGEQQRSQLLQRVGQHELRHWQQRIATLHSRLRLHRSCESQEDYAFRRWTATLFVAFSPEAFWWTLVILVRRGLLIALDNVFATSAASNRYLAFGVLHTFVLLLHFSFRPYLIRGHNWLEAVSIAAHILLALLLCTFPPPFDNGVKMVVEVLCFAPPIFILVWGFGSKHVQQRAYVLIVRDRWSSRQQQKPSEEGSLDERRVADKLDKQAKWNAGLASSSSSEIRKRIASTEPSTVHNSPRQYELPALKLDQSYALPASAIQMQPLRITRAGSEPLHQEQPHPHSHAETTELQPIQPALSPSGAMQLIAAPTSVSRELSVPRAASDEGKVEEEAEEDKVGRVAEPAHWEMEAEVGEAGRTFAPPTSEV